MTRVRPPLTRSSKSLNRPRALACKGQVCHAAVEMPSNPVLVICHTIHFSQMSPSQGPSDAYPDTHEIWDCAVTSPWPTETMSLPSYYLHLQHSPTYTTQPTLRLPRGPLYAFSRVPLYMSSPVFSSCCSTLPTFPLWA